MNFKKRALSLVCILATAPWTGEVNISTAAFGAYQNFWPGIHKKSNSGKQSKGDIIGILPLSDIRLVESIPCDSCHWLSKNSLQFVMENYLLQMCRAESPALKHDLVIPQNPLLKAGKIELEKNLRTWAWPWNKIFAEPGSPIIFRPRDNFTPPEIKTGLDKIGGQLGVNYLLIPLDWNMHVWPRSSQSHKGKFALEFYLVFWNVVLSYPEWIIHFKTKTSTVDLDVPIDKFMAKNLSPYISKIPAELNELLSREPH